jgi:predicted RND superfamily exporter protein
MVLSPLAIGIIWMGGVMYLVGMKLNLFNIVVIPSIIGIGVDNGVHIYHRYMEQGKGSLYFVLRHTGLAISMTTLTTIVGYSGLILASHPGLNSIGSLAVIGISATFLAAVVALPAFLQSTETT